MKAYDHSLTDYLASCRFDSSTSDEKRAAVGAYTAIRNCSWCKSELFDKFPWFGVAKFVFRQSEKKPSEITEAIEYSLHQLRESGINFASTLIEMCSPFLEQPVIYNEPEFPLMYTPAIPFQHSESKLAEAIGIGQYSLPELVEQIDDVYSLDAKGTRILCAMIAADGAVESPIDFGFTVMVADTIGRALSLSKFVFFLELLYAEDKNVFIKRFVREDLL